MANERTPRILIVDDVPENARLLEAVLAPSGYDVLVAYDGETALARAGSADLVLLDVVLPDLDGYMVRARLRERQSTTMLPVIMVTSSVGEQKLRGIEAGADDFIPKPFNHQELLTRVRSLLRIKRYYDTIKRQAEELEVLNRTLERRVQEQVDELERVRRLQRFLSAQLAEALISAGTESVLDSHRRLLSMLFVDLRGWTSFVDSVEPEEAMGVLREFHKTIGLLVRRFDATVGFLQGDGVQLFFNDPIEIPDAPLRSIELGCALRDEVGELPRRWAKRSFELSFGAGIALGYATCGEVGFDARSDYAAIGSVTNLASRLADETSDGQILISKRLYAEIDDQVDVESTGEFVLKGFARPIPAYNVLRVRAQSLPDLGRRRLLRLAGHETGVPTAPGLSAQNRPASAARGSATPMPGVATVHYNLCIGCAFLGCARERTPQVGHAGATSAWGTLQTRLLSGGVHATARGPAEAASRAPVRRGPPPARAVLMAAASLPAHQSARSSSYFCAPR